MEELIKKWLDFARFSPSGGNSQPWFAEYKIENGKIFLKLGIGSEYKDRKTAMDVDGAAAVISLGCVIKSLEIISKHDNFIILNKKTENNGPLYWGTCILLTLAKSEAILSSKYSLNDLKIRRTNREPYSNQEITLAVGNKLEEVIKNYSHIKILKTANLNPTIVYVWGQLERIRWSNNFFLKSIVGEMNIIHHEKGLPISQLGVSLADMFLVAFLKIIPFFNYFFKFGGYHISIKKGVINPLKSSAHFCVLSVKENNLNSSIELGEFFMEYWIEANRNGVSIQPICNSLVAYAGLCKSDYQFFNEEEINDIKKIREEMLEKLGFDLAIPTLGFRMGYAKTYTEQSPRAEFQLKENSNL